MWIILTKWHFDYPRCLTRTHWHSIDAQFVDWVGTVSLLFLPLTATNTSLIDVCSQLPSRVPKIQNPRWLTPHYSHVPNGTVTMSLSLLPIKAANMLVMHKSDQISFQLPYLHDQISRTLHWCSFWCFVHSNAATIKAGIHNYLILFVAFLTDWEFGLLQSWAYYYYCTGQSDCNTNFTSC